MTPRVKFVGLWAVAGLLVAFAIWCVPGTFNMPLMFLRSRWIERTLIFLWPSGVWLANGDISYFPFVVFTAVVNSALYAGVGTLFYFGLRKSKIVLGLTIAALVAAYYWIVVQAVV